MAIFLETKCRIQWNDEKKEHMISYYKEYFWWIVESIIIAPSPNFWITGNTTIYNYSSLEL
jgi:hypothetical protein